MKTPYVRLGALACCGILAAASIQQPCVDQSCASHSSVKSASLLQSTEAKTHAQKDLADTKTLNPPVGSTKELKSKTEGTTENFFNTVEADLLQAQPWMLEMIFAFGILLAFLGFCIMQSTATGDSLSGKIWGAVEQMTATDAEVHSKSKRWHQQYSECFKAGGVLCLDGGTGSEVERVATQLKPGDEAVNAAGWSCVQWKTHPDILRGVHLKYLQSGAKLVIANSYATNRHIMKGAGYEHLTRQATLAAVRLAREARDAHMAEAGPSDDSPSLVAGSMSCHPPGMAHGANMNDGQWPEPAVEKKGYEEQARLLKEAGADVIFIEMVWDWKKHGVLAVKSAASVGLPVVISFTVFDAKSCDEGMPQLHDGTFLEDAAGELSSGEGWENVVALAIHHTKLPLVLPCLNAMGAGGWKGLLGAYPDHGTFEMPHWRFEPLEADKILDYVSQWVEQTNCQMVGGCCGIGPETIEKMGKWCSSYNKKKCQRR